MPDDLATAEEAPEPTQAERDLDPETYVRWHPAGALGASILGAQPAVV